MARSTATLSSMSLLEATRRHYQATAGCMWPRTCPSCCEAERQKRHKEAQHTSPQGHQTFSWLEECNLAQPDHRRDHTICAAVHCAHWRELHIPHNPIHQIFPILRLSVVCTVFSLYHFTCAPIMAESNLTNGKLPALRNEQVKKKRGGPEMLPSIL